MSQKRTILDCLMHKLPSSRKYYRVTLVIPDNGIPLIEYHQANSSKKPNKSIQFVDLLFADKKHDSNDKFAFSVYSIDKTITFLAQDETTMNEWLTKIRECHSNLYPEFKRYDSIFEATLLDKGLAKTMNIRGPYRLAMSKDSLDLIPLLPSPQLLSNQQQQATTKPTPHETSTTYLLEQNNGNETKLHSTNHLSFLSTINPISSNTTSITPHSNLHLSHHHHQSHHHQLPQHLPHQRLEKRHPLLRSKTIELVLRSIRRCGHTDCNFYIESGRHSQIGEGDLWMALNKKSTARHLHELLLATMKSASTVEDQYIYKAPRSRSGSSSENARSQQSRSSSIICLASDPATPINNMNSLSNQIQAAALAAATSTINSISTIPMLSNDSKTNNNIDEDSGYLPMA